MLAFSYLCPVPDITCIADGDDLNSNSFEAKGGTIWERRCQCLKNPAVNYGCRPLVWWTSLQLQKGKLVKVNGEGHGHGYGPREFSATHSCLRRQRLGA